MTSFHYSAKIWSNFGYPRAGQLHVRGGPNFTVPEAVFEAEEIRMTSVSSHQGNMSVK